MQTRSKFKPGDHVQVKRHLKVERLADEPSVLAQGTTFDVVEAIDPGEDISEPYVSGFVSGMPVNVNESEIELARR